MLVSGHKKDLVITNRLAARPGQLAIYGWHRALSDPIQSLSTVHGAGYADYSHGVRLVSQKAILDGNVRSVYDIQRDPVLALQCGIDLKPRIQVVSGFPRLPVSRRPGWLLHR